MKKHNAFREAETLVLNLWGAYEWLPGTAVHSDRSLLTSYE